MLPVLVRRGAKAASPVCLADPPQYTITVRTPGEVRVGLRSLRETAGTTNLPYHVTFLMEKAELYVFVFCFYIYCALQNVLCFLVVAYALLYLFFLLVSDLPHLGRYVI